MGDNNVIVISSDEEDETTLWKSKATDDHFQKLFKTVKRIIFNRTRPSYISGGFPYGRFVEYIHELETALATVESRNTRRFIWRCAVRWLIPLKNCIRGPIPLFNDWKYNYIVTDIMTQYINFKCAYYHAREPTIIKEQVEEIIRMLEVAFSCKTEFIFITFLKIQIRYEYREILIPLFRAYLISPLNYDATDFCNYVCLVLCYRQWKRLIRTKEDRETINEYACGQIKRLMGTYRPIDLTLNPVLPWEVPKATPKNEIFFTLHHHLTTAKGTENGTRLLLASVWRDWGSVLRKFIALYEEYNRFGVQLEPEVPVLELPDMDNNDDDDDDDVVLIPNEEAVIVIPDDDDLPSTDSLISNVNHLKFIDKLKRLAERTPPKSLEEQEKTEKALQCVQSRHYTDKQGTTTAVNQHLSNDCDISSLSKTLKSSNLSSHSDRLSGSFKTQQQVTYIYRYLRSSFNENRSCIELDTTDDESDNDDNYFIRDEVTDKIDDDLTNDLVDKKVETNNDEKGDGETTPPAVSNFIAELKRRAIEMGTKISKKSSASPIVLSSDDDEPVIIDPPAVQEDNPENSIVINEIVDSSSENEVTEREFISPRLRPPENVEERPLRREKLRCITGEVSSTTSLGCSSTPNTENISIQNESALENAREVGTLSAVHTSSPKGMNLSIADYSDISDDDLDISLSESRQAPKQCWSKFSKVVEEATSSTSELPIKAGSEAPSENVIFSVPSNRGRRSTSSRTNSPTDSSRLISPSSTIRTRRCRYYRARNLSRIPVPTFNTLNRILEDSELPTCSRYIRRMPNADNSSKDHDEGLQVCENKTDLPASDKATCSRYEQKKNLDIDKKSTLREEEEKGSSNSKLKHKQYSRSKPSRLVKPNFTRSAETVREACTFESPSKFNSAKGKQNLHISQNDNSDLNKFLDDISSHIGASGDDVDKTAVETSSSESTDERRLQINFKNLTSKGTEVSPAPQIGIHSKGNVEFKANISEPNKEVLTNVGQKTFLDVERTEIDYTLSSPPNDCSLKSRNENTFILKDPVLEHSYFSRMHNSTNDTGQENFSDQIPVSLESEVCERKETIAQKSESSKKENTECQNVLSKDHVKMYPNDKTLSEDSDDLSYLQEIGRDSLEYSPLSSNEDDFLLADDELSNEELENEDDIESPAYEPIIPKAHEEVDANNTVKEDIRQTEALFNDTSHPLTLNNDICKPVLEEESLKIDIGKEKSSKGNSEEILENDVLVAEDLVNHSISNNDVVVHESTVINKNNLVATNDSVSEQLCDLVKSLDFEKMLTVPNEKVQATQTSINAFDHNLELDITTPENVIATESVMNDDDLSKRNESFHNTLTDLSTPPFNIPCAKIPENVCSIIGTDSVLMTDSDQVEEELPSLKMPMLCEQPSLELNTRVEETLSIKEMEFAQSSQPQDVVVSVNVDFTESQSSICKKDEIVNATIFLEIGDSNNERKCSANKDSTEEKAQASQTVSMAEIVECPAFDSAIPSKEMQYTEQPSENNCPLLESEITKTVISENSFPLQTDDTALDDNEIPNINQLPEEMNKSSSNHGDGKSHEQVSENKSLTANADSESSEVINERVIEVDTLAKSSETLKETIENCSIAINPSIPGTPTIVKPSTPSPSDSVLTEAEKLSEATENLSNLSSNKTVSNVTRTGMASLVDTGEGSEEEKAKFLSEASSKSENISLSAIDVSGSVASLLGNEHEGLKHTSSENCFDISDNQTLSDIFARINHMSVTQEKCVVSAQSVEESKCIETQSPCEKISETVEEKATSDQFLRSKSVSPVDLNDTVPMHRLEDSGFSNNADNSASSENLSLELCDDVVLTSVTEDHITAEKQKHLNLNESASEKLSSVDNVKSLDNNVSTDTMHEDEVELTNNCGESTSNVECVSSLSANNLRLSSLPRKVYKNKKFKTMTEMGSSPNPGTASENSVPNQLNNVSPSVAVLSDKKCDVENRDDFSEEECSAGKSEIADATRLTSANENASIDVKSEVNRESLLIDKSEAACQQSEFVENIESASAIEQQKLFQERTSSRNSNCDLSEEQAVTPFESVSPSDVQNTSTLTDDEIKAKYDAKKSQATDSDDKDNADNSAKQSSEKESRSVPENGLSPGQGNKTGIEIEQQEIFKDCMSSAFGSCDLSEQQPAVAFESKSFSDDQNISLVEDEIKAKDVAVKPNFIDPNDQDNAKSTAVPITEPVEKPSMQKMEETPVSVEIKKQEGIENRSDSFKKSSIENDSVDVPSEQVIVVDSVNVMSEIETKSESNSVSTDTVNVESVPSKDEFVTETSAVSENSSSFESDDTSKDKITRLTEITDTISALQAFNIESVVPLQGDIAQDPQQKLSKDTIEDHIVPLPAYPLNVVPPSGPLDDVIKAVDDNTIAELNLSSKNALSEGEGVSDESAVSNMEPNHIIDPQVVQNSTNDSDNVSKTELIVVSLVNEIKDSKRKMSKESNEGELAPPSIAGISNEKDTQLDKEHTKNDDVAETVTETDPLPEDQFETEIATKSEGIPSEKISDTDLSLASLSPIEDRRQTVSKKLVEEQSDQTRESSSFVAQTSEIKLQNHNVSSKADLNTEKLHSEDEFSSENSAISRLDKNINQTKAESIEKKVDSTEKYKPHSLITKHIQDSKQTPPKELNHGCIPKPPVTDLLLNGFAKEKLSAKDETVRKKNGAKCQNIQNESVDSAVQDQRKCNAIRVAKEILSIEDYAMVKSCKSFKTDKSEVESCNAQITTVKTQNKVQNLVHQQIMDKNQVNLQVVAPCQEQRMDKNPPADYLLAAQPSPQAVIFSNTCQTYNDISDINGKKQPGSKGSVLQKRSDIEFQENALHRNSREKQSSVYEGVLNNNRNLEKNEHRSMQAMNIEQSPEINKNVIPLNYQLRNSSFGKCPRQSGALNDMRSESKRPSNEQIYYVPRNPNISMHADNSFVLYPDRCSASKVITNGSVHTNTFKDHESSCRPNNLSIRSAPFVNQIAERDNFNNFTWPKATDEVNKNHQQQHLCTSKPQDVILHNKFSQYFASERRYPPLLQGVLEDATYKSHIGKTFQRTPTDIAEPVAKKQKILTDPYTCIDYSKVNERRDELPNNRTPNEGVSSHRMRIDSSAHLVEKNESLKPEGNTSSFSTWSNEAEIQFLLKLRQTQSIYTGDDSNQSIQVQVAAEDLGDPLSSFDCETGNNSPAYGFETPYRECNSNTPTHCPSITHPIEDIEDQEVSRITSQEVAETPYNTYNDDCGTPVMDEKDAEEIETSPCQGKIVSLSILKAIPELPQFPSTPTGIPLYQTHPTDTQSAMHQREVIKLTDTACPDSSHSFEPINTPSTPTEISLRQNHLSNTQSDIPQRELIKLTDTSCPDSSHSLKPINQPSTPIETSVCQSSCLDVSESDKSQREFIKLTDTGCPDSSQHLDPINTPKASNESESISESTPVTAFIEPSPKPKPTIDIDSEYQKTPLKMRLKRRISQCADINEEFNLGPSEPVKPIDILATQALERKQNESVIESVESAKHIPVCNYPTNLSVQASDRASELEKDQNLLYQESWYKKLGKTKTADKTPNKKHNNLLLNKNTHSPPDNSDALAMLQLSGNYQKTPSGLSPEDSPQCGKNEGRRRKPIRVRKLTDLLDHESDMSPNVYAPQPTFQPTSNACHSPFTYPAIGQAQQSPEVMICPQPMSVLETTYNPEDIKAATILSDMLKTSYKIDENLKNRSPKTPRSRKSTSPRSYKQTPLQFRRMTRSTTQLMVKLPPINTTNTSQSSLPTASPINSTNTSQPSLPTAPPINKTNTSQSSLPTAPPINTTITSQPSLPTASPINSTNTSQSSLPTAPPINTTITSQPSSPTAPPVLPAMQECNDSKSEAKIVSTNTIWQQDKTREILRSLSSETQHKVDKTIPYMIGGERFEKANRLSNSSSDSDDVGKLVIDMGDTKSEDTKKKTVSRSTGNSLTSGTVDQTALEKTTLSKTNELHELRNVSPSKYNAIPNSKSVFTHTPEADVFLNLQNINQSLHVYENNNHFITNSMEDDVAALYPIVQLTELAPKSRSKRATRKTQAKSLVREIAKSMLSSPKTFKEQQNTKACVVSPKSRKSKKSKTKPDPINGKQKETDSVTEATIVSTYELPTSDKSPSEIPETTSTFGVDAILHDDKSKEKPTPSPRDSPSLPPETATNSQEYWLKTFLLMRKSTQQVTDEPDKMKNKIQPTREPKSLMDDVPSCAATQAHSETTLVQDLKVPTPQKGTDVVVADKKRRRKKKKSLLANETTPKCTSSSSIDAEMCKSEKSKKKVTNVQAKSNSVKSNCTAKPVQVTTASTDDSQGSESTTESTQIQQNSQPEIAVPGDTESTDCKIKTTKPHDLTTPDSENPQEIEANKSVEDISAPLTETVKESDVQLPVQPELKVFPVIAAVDLGITQQVPEERTQESNVSQDADNCERTKNELEESKKSEKLSSKISSQSVIAEKVKSCENLNQNIESNEKEPKKARKCEKLSSEVSVTNEIENHLEENNKIERKEQKSSDEEFDDSSVKTKNSDNSHKELENKEIDSKETNQSEERSAISDHTLSAIVDKPKRRRSSSKKLENEENKSKEEGKNDENCSAIAHKLSVDDDTAEQSQNYDENESNETKSTHERALEQTPMSQDTTDKTENLTETTTISEDKNSPPSEDTTMKSIESSPLPLIAEESIDEYNGKQNEYSAYNCTSSAVLEKESGRFKYKCRMQIRRFSIDDNNLKITLGRSTEKHNRHSKKHSKTQRRFSVGICDVIRCSAENEQKVKTQEICHVDGEVVKATKLNCTDDTLLESEVKESDLLIAAGAVATIAETKTEEKDLFTASNENGKVNSVTVETEADEQSSSLNNETVTEINNSTDNEDNLDEDANSAQIEDEIQIKKAEKIPLKDAENLQQVALEIIELKDAKVIDFTDTEVGNLPLKTESEEGKETPSKEENLTVDQNLSKDSPTRSIPENAAIAMENKSVLSKVVESKFSRKRSAPKSKKSKEKSKRKRLEEVTLTDSEEDVVEIVEEEHVIRHAKELSEECSSEEKETRFNENFSECPERTDATNEAPSQSTVSQRRPAPKSRKRQNSQLTTQKKRLVVLLKRLKPMKEKPVHAITENNVRPMQTHLEKNIQRKSLDCDNSRSNFSVSLRIRSKSTDMKRSSPGDQQSKKLKPFKLNISKLEACHQTLKEMNCSEPTTSYEAKLYDESERLAEQLNSFIKKILEDSDDSSTNMLLTSRPQIFDRVPKDIFAGNGDISDNIGAKYYSPILPPKPYDIILKSTPPEDGHLNSKAAAEEENIKPCSDATEQEAETEDAENSTNLISSNNSDGNSAPDLELDASEMPQIPDVGIICEEDSIPDLCAETECLSEVLDDKIDKEVLDANIDTSTPFIRDYMISGNYRSNNYLDLPLLPGFEAINLLDVQNQFQNDNGDGNGLLVPKVENLADVEIDFGSELFLYSGCIQSQDSSGSSDDKRDQECETPTPAIDPYLATTSTHSTETISKTTTKENELVNEIVAEEVTQESSTSNISQNQPEPVEVSIEVGFETYNELLAENNPFFLPSVLKDGQSNVNSGNDTELDKEPNLQTKPDDILANLVKEVGVDESEDKDKESLSSDKQSLVSESENSTPSDKEVARDSVADAKESGKIKRDRIKVLPIETLKPEDISTPVKLKSRPIPFWKIKKLETKIPPTSVNLENKSPTITVREISKMVTPPPSVCAVISECNLGTGKPVETGDLLIKEINVVNSSESSEDVSNCNSSPTCDGKTTKDKPEEIIDVSAETQSNKITQLPELNELDTSHTLNSVQTRETQSVQSSQLPELNENKNTCNSIQNKETPSPQISKLPELNEVLSYKHKLDTDHTYNSNKTPEVQPIKISKRPELNEIVQSNHSINSKQNNTAKPSIILQKLPELNEVSENKHKLSVGNSCGNPSKKIRNETAGKLSIDDLFDRLKRESPVNPLMHKVKYSLKKSSSFETDDNSSRDSTMGLLTAPESPRPVISNVSSPAAVIGESAVLNIAPSMPILTTPSRSEMISESNSNNSTSNGYNRTSKTLRTTRSLPAIDVQPSGSDIAHETPVARKDLKRPSLKDDMIKPENTCQKTPAKVTENIPCIKKLDPIQPSTDCEATRKNNEKHSKPEKNIESLKKPPPLATTPVSSPKLDTKTIQRVTFASEVIEIPKVDLFLSASKSNAESSNSTQKPMKSILVSPIKHSGSQSSDSYISRRGKYNISENNSLEYSSPISDGYTSSHSQKFNSLKVRSSPYRSSRTEKIVAPKATQSHSKSHSSQNSTDITENNRYSDYKKQPHAPSNHSRSSSSSTETANLITSLSAELEWISNTLKRLPEPKTYAQHSYRKRMREKFEQKMQHLHELKKRRYKESERHNQSQSKSKSYSDRQPFDNSSNHKGSVHTSHRESKEEYRNDRVPYVNKFGELGTKNFQITDTCENRAGNCREAKRLPSWDLKQISAEDIIADLKMKKSRRN